MAQARAFPDGLTEIVPDAVMSGFVGHDENEAAGSDGVTSRDGTELVSAENGSVEIEWTALEPRRPTARGLDPDDHHRPDLVTAAAPSASAGVEHPHLEESR